MVSSSLAGVHGRAVLDFSTQAGCVTSWCHVRICILDLLMTVIPDLVNVSVSSPIGGLDRLSLSVIIMMFSEFFQGTCKNSINVIITSRVVSSAHFLLL